MTDQKILARFALHEIKLSPLSFMLLITLYEGMACKNWGENSLFYLVDNRANKIDFVY